MSKIFEQILAARGVGARYLRPKYEDLIPAGKMPDIEKAVERIRQAVERGEKVLIYGDYDVDGVTASATMHDTLTMAGLKEVEIMLPNRFTDGYGMSEKILEKVQDECSLVVTVDCGSGNHEIIEKLTEMGVDVVVTDHHECREELPKALAIVNPKRSDVGEMGELRELAGVGVVFKLAQALVKAGLIKAGQEKWLLDLVLIGTVCDSMPMGQENHTLCYYGMKVLEKTRRPGLVELKRLAGVRRLNTDAIGYQIGPRLNAAGRMETAEKALKLVMTKNRLEAVRLAEELEQLNSERKRQQNTAVDEIKKRGPQGENVIVEVGEWHEGVVGIIAGKLTESYKKPSIVLTQCGEVLKGSGRSFGDFNLAKALVYCKDVIVGGGGHAEACGLKVTPEKLDEFIQKINEYHASLGLEGQEKYLEIKEDVEAREHDMLNLGLLDEIRQLEPYGPGNEMPVLKLPGARVMNVSRLGDEERHLRLLLADARGRTIKAMWFYAPEKWLKLNIGDEVDVWITLEENEYLGTRSVEGRIAQIMAC